MLVDTSSWYLADTTLLFGELANHYAVLSTGQPRLPRGGCSKLGGNYEVPKDTHSNGLLCYENVHNHMSFTTMQMSQMMLN